MKLELQELYNNYQQEKNELKQEKILQKLHKYIYRYTYIRFQTDADTASDFYLYIYEKILLLVKEYNPDFGIPFFVFISTHLRFHYSNFLQKRKSDALKYVQYKIWDYSTHEFISTDNKKNKKFSSELKYSIHEKLFFILNNVDILTIKEDTIFRLYYGLPLQLKHFRIILEKYSKENKNFAFITLRDYQKKLLQYKNQTYINARYVNNIERLNINQNKIEKINSIGRVNVQIEEKMEKIQKKKEKILSKFKRIKINAPVSIEIVAKVMNGSTSSVRPYIIYAKDKLKEKLQEMKISNLVKS